jgi:hemoglobin/transferrin/lactoferrin receptor protein
LQKFAYKTNNGFEHGLNLQFSTSSDIPRYDRLTETTASGLRSAEWYYGPQQRLLGVYSLEKKKAFFDTDFKINIAYQNAKESRHNRNFKKYDLQNREENVNMFSVSVDLKKEFTKSELFYGLESYYETLKSSAFSNNINTGVIAPITTRYPNGDNTMLRNDFYVSYNEKLSKNTFWNAGARVGFTKLKSTIADNTLFPLPYDAISQNNFTYSGTAGLKHNTSNNFALKANISSGFRVANIDDLSKIFESAPSKNGSQVGILIVPNKNLKPEKTVTTDLGFTMQSESKKTTFAVTYFYTKMFDAIVVDSFTYNGQSQVIFNDFLNDVKANQNKRKAYITGFSTSFSTYLCTSLQFNATFDYTLGKVVEVGKQSPLDHISPYFGKIGVTYTKNLVAIEAYLLFNGKKNLRDYSSSGEDNLVYAPENGMPAWETYNCKASFNIIKCATLFAGIENILDTQYRVFASGINAPGRNIYGGLKYNF